MKIHKRTDCNKKTKNIPKPKISCAELVINASSGKLIADTAAEIVEPNKRSYFKSQRTNNKEQEAIIHCLFGNIEVCFFFEEKMVSQKWISFNEEDLLVTKGQI